MTPSNRFSKEKVTQSWLGSTILDKFCKYYNVKMNMLCYCHYIHIYYVSDIIQL